MYCLKNEISDFKSVRVDDWLRNDEIIDIKFTFYPQKVEFEAMLLEKRHSHSFEKIFACYFVLNLCIGC